MLCAGYQLCKLTSSVGSLPLLLTNPLTAKHDSYLKSTILDDLIKHRLSNGQCTVDGELRAQLLRLKCNVAVCNCDSVC